MGGGKGRRDGEGEKGEEKGVREKRGGEGRGLPCWSCWSGAELGKWPLTFGLGRT